MKEKRNEDDMREFPSISEFDAEMKVERGFEVVEDCQDSDSKENEVLRIPSGIEYSWLCLQGKSQ